MSSPIDPISLLHLLEEAGFSRAQAEAQLRAFVALLSTRSPTIRHLRLVEKRLRVDIQQSEKLLKAEMERQDNLLRAEAEQLEKRLKAEMEQLEARLRAEIEQLEKRLRAEIEQLEKRLQAQIEKLRLEHQLALEKLRTDMHAVETRLVRAEREGRRQVIIWVAGMLLGYSAGLLGLGRLAGFFR